MRKDRDNPLALSSNKPCQGQTDYKPELERLRAELEAEKTQTQRVRGHLCLELRHLREKAERDQQRTVRELTARRGCQKDRRCNSLLAKQVNVKDSGRYGEVEPSGKEAFCLCSGETYTKLEQLLLTLNERINGEQAVYKLHHRQELELEKAIFLCHLLEAHGRLLHWRPRAGHSSYIFNHLSRKPTPEDSSNFCQTSSRARLHRSHSGSSSPKRKPKQDQRQQPSGRALRAADPCTTAAVVDTCRSSSLKICHPHGAPHAGWDVQPTCCAESSGSDESPPSKCMDRNMEVRYFTFRTWFPN